MSNPKYSALQHGWVRALVFFAIFLAVFVLSNQGYQQLAKLPGFFPAISSALPPTYVNAILLAVSAFIVVLPFRKYIDKKSISSLGFEWKDTSRYAALGFLFPVVILGAGSLLLYANKNINYHDAFYPGPDLIKGLILMAVITLTEELVFRGYILNNLLSSFNKWLALPVSALLFAFVHSANPNVSLIALVNVFVAGLLIGLPYIYTRNLWFSVFFHFSWNFLQGPILGFEVSGLELESVVKADVSGNILLTGGQFGFEGSVIQTVLFIIVLFVLFLFFETRQISLQKNKAEESDSL